MQACFVCVVLLFNPDLSKAVTQYLSVGSTPLFGLWSVWYQHVTFSMINVSIKRPLGAHLNKTVNKSILSFFYSGFPRETTELKFRLGFFFRSVANRSQVLITHSQPFEPDACAKFWPMSTQDGVMADVGELSRRKISRDNVYKTLKTHIKYAHIVRGRPTLKEVERFRKGSVREPYEIPIYEWTFHRETCYINWAI